MNLTKANGKFGEAFSMAFDKIKITGNGKMTKNKAKANKNNGSGSGKY